MTNYVQKRFLPPASLYFCTPDKKTLFEKCILIQHRTQGLGQIRDIEFRGPHDQMFHVDYSKVGHKKFLVNSVAKGFITSLQINKETLTTSELQKLDELERLGSEITPILNLAKRCKDIIFSYPDVEHKPPSLSKMDYSLIAAWSSITPPLSIKSAEALVKNIGAYHASRLASARRAELVVMHHYHKMGLSVEDISATQLNQSQSEWKDFDLLIEGFPVDVKNARRSLGNPDNYSEQYVKSFKHSESKSEDVFIAATLSPYAQISSQGESEKVTFLGMLAKSGLKKSSEWLYAHRDLVSVNGFSERAGFLPGWLFDYGREFYRLRMNLQAEVDKWLATTISQEAFDFAISDEVSGPLIVSAIWASGENSARFVSTDDPLGQIMAQGLSRCNLNRRTIFLALLVYFLICIRRGEAPEFQYLRKLLFPRQMYVGRENQPQQKYPLLLHDPCKYIWSLIDSFETMHVHASEQLRAISYFRLAGPNILRGKTTKGDWITLLAYCGGRYEPYNVKCGKNPLVLGINRPCPRCGFLICDKCGFCSEKCKT